MRRLLKLVRLGLAGYGAVVLWQRLGRGVVEKWRATRGRGAESGEIGHDTPTGTDPYAKYEQPGYEDKSFGQAVKADQELADRLVREEHGDTESAERRFAREAAGAPAIARQQGPAR